ncbi:hypothetical protein E2C01_036599 [Portunus trituberculatus]|uniref:Uncharacterized protein n=1 Tax=Portunus trituberculatus TaxID=210409 RepID=A0A5B7FBT2_PORTR|nr:hypothetical protein [Portunus trituberculatus]
MYPPVCRFLPIRQTSRNTIVVRETYRTNEGVACERHVARAGTWVAQYLCGVHHPRCIRHVKAVCGPYIDLGLGNSVVKGSARGHAGASSILTHGSHLRLFWVSACRCELVRAADVVQFLCCHLSRLARVQMNGCCVGPRIRVICPFVPRYTRNERKSPCIFSGVKTSLMETKASVVRRGTVLTENAAATDSLGAARGASGGVAYFRVSTSCALRASAASHVLTCTYLFFTLWPIVSVGILEEYGRHCSASTH